MYVTIYSQNDLKLILLVLLPNRTVSVPTTAKRKPKQLEE